MVDPKFHIHRQCPLQVLRRSGHPAGQGRVKLGSSLGVGRPIGNLLHIAHLGIRLVGIGNQPLGLVDMPRAFDDCPVVHAIQTARPYHGQRAALLRRHGDAPAVGRSHDNITCSQPLCRLGAGVPPLDIGLEFAKLGECTFNPGRRRQHLIDVLHLHAIGQQGELQVVHRTLAQAALARVLVHVPEVGPRGRCFRQLVAVIGNGHAPHQRSRAAGLRRVGDQLGGMAQALPVKLLVNPLITAAHQVWPLDLHHVPIDVAGVGHHLDPRHLTVVFALDQLAAILGTEGFEDGLVLGLLASAAIAHHDHLRRGLSTAQAKCQQRCAKASHTG